MPCLQVKPGLLSRRSDLVKEKLCFSQAEDTDLGIKACEGSDLYSGRNY